jgi:hypothetical protein
MKNYIIDVQQVVRGAIQTIQPDSLIKKSTIPGAYTD